MGWKCKLIISGLLAASSVSMFVPPARADLDDALREVGRAIRREVRDDRRDRVREAICYESRGDFRRVCRAVDRINEVGDEIRQG